MPAHSDSRQEVNLYLPELCKSEVLLNANRALLALAVFAGLLAFVQLGLGWRNASLEQAQQEVQRQLRQLEQSVAGLRHRQPQTRGAALAAQVSGLQRQLEHSRQVSRLIEGQNLGNAAGFSRQLQDMARQAPADMHLVGFRLSRGGGVVELEGWARQAEAVPRYIQRLRGEESFQTASFGNMVIVRDSAAGLLRFSLGDIAGGGAP